MYSRSRCHGASMNRKAHFWHVWKVDYVTITEPMWIGFFALIGGLIFVAVLRSFRCRFCRRWFALKATGRSKFTGQTLLTQYECRFCNKDVWKGSSGGTMDSFPSGG